MTDPLTFPSATPRHALPQLFVGQAQKEATVNAAHALADLLLHPAIEGEATTPPADPGEGECWLVAAPASAAFAGREETLAGFAAGSWTFARPQEGMRALDKSTGQFLLYRDGWRREEAPAEPTGGAVVDVEGRAAIVAILHLLKRSAILAGE